MPAATTSLGDWLNGYMWADYSSRYGIDPWGGPFGDNSGVGVAALFIGIPDGTSSDSSRGIVVTMRDSNTSTSFTSDKYEVSCDGTTPTIERLTNHILIAIAAGTSCDLRVYINDGTGAAYEMQGASGPMALEYTSTLSREGDLYKLTAGLFGKTTPAASTADAPTSLVATADDGQLSVAFTAPADDGGAEITNYEYSTDGGTTWLAFSPAVTTSPATITGLTNGTSYSVALRAVNSVGSGTASATTTATPGVTPDAPTALSATAGDGQVSVSFTPPSVGSGAEITNYEYSTDGGTTWLAFSPAVTTSPVTITGLTNGTPYSIALRAVNLAGAGTASATTTATPAAAADAPTGLSVTAGDAQATVTFTPPANDGGMAITNYQYSTDGGTTWLAFSPAVTTSPATITGLTNGASYQIALRAVTEAGPGASSGVVLLNTASPATLLEDAEEAVRKAVQNEAARSLRSTISASQGMVRDARDRFVRTNRLSGCSDAAAATCTADGAVPLAATGSFAVDGTTLSTNGTFFGQTANLDGAARQLIFGNFDIQHDGETGSSTLSATGRMAWEWPVSGRTLIGYFVGGEVSQSDIAGDFNGNNRRLGMTVGGYAVHQLRDNIFADGFVSLGAGRNNLEMSDDVLGLQSDYTSQTLAFGAALSGRFDQGDYLFLPELAVSYGKTQIGKMAFTGQADGLTDDSLGLDAGAVSLADITFRPEFRFALDGLPVTDSLDLFTFAPRFMCQEMRADTVSRTCGAGAEVGISRQSDSGLTSYDVRIIAERIGKQTGTSLLLGLERKF